MKTTLGALALTAALAATTLPTLITAAEAAPQGPQGPPHCHRQAKVAVPGAEVQAVSCLADLTTAGTVASGHTNPDDWSGLHAPGTTNPTGVPGIQVDGYFPDTSTSNTNHGWAHDAQFVLRLPDDWNGKLVVSGAPGVRRQYAGDYIFSDWLVAQGYAYAMTDKGNSGLFHHDGEEPGDAVAEWNDRVTELTRAAKATVKQRYGMPAKRTYALGISNGGYLVRWQLENHPELYDGGVDWEGTLFKADGPNLFTYLPTALRDYPAYAAGDEAAHQRMLDVGFAPGSEFTWDFHHGYYWDVTQRIYREEFDPSWDGDLDAGIPFCTSGTPSCDADYDWSTRPDAQAAMEKVELAGAIGKPMLTLHGTYDALLPIATDSDVYAPMVEDAGSGHLHRYYRFEAGVHTDGLHALYGDRIRPLLPCAREAFTDLTRWVERRHAPPASATLAQPESGDLVNTCSLS